MAQVRVPQTEWEALNVKAQKARTCWANLTFLNEPVLLDGHYVWDDHRITEDHEFVMSEVRKERPTASETEPVVLARVQAKLDARRAEQRVPAVRPDEVIIDDPLVRNPNG